ncbi:MAG: class I SAM-dependent methyltransferase [Chloroflexales bacterium]
MKEIPCSLCGSAQRNPLVSGRDRQLPQNPRTYSLHRCTRCGMVYLSPRPDTPDELDEIYPREYAPYMREGQRLLMVLRRLARRPEVREILGYTHRESLILEVGSATGEFLDDLRWAGRPHLIGLELSTEAARVARERYGLDVRAGDLPGAGLPSGSCDLVVMRHVLEHLPDPRAALLEVARVLRPGGRCILTFPNVDSLSARIFGADWYGYDIPRHTYLFPRRALALLLAASGLQAERLIHTAAPNAWIGSVRFWLISCGRPRLAQLFRYENPLALALFMPLGLISAAVRSSGTVRMIARRVG